MVAKGDLSTFVRRFTRLWLAVCRNRRIPWRRPQGDHASMPLVNLVVSLIVVGLLLWLVNNYIPMDGKIKTILNVVVVIAVVLWVLSAFGVLGPLSSYRVGRSASAIHAPVWQAASVEPRGADAYQEMNS